MNDLIEIDDEKLQEVLSTGKGIEDILAQVEKLVSSFEYDLSTDLSRYEIQKFYNKIFKLRTHIGHYRSAMIGELTRKANLIARHGAALRTGLNQYEDIVLAPLIQWGKEENERWRAEFEVELEQAKKLMHEGDEMNDLQEAERVRLEAERAKLQAEQAALKAQQEAIDAENRRQAEEAERKRQEIERQAQIQATAEWRARVWTDILDAIKPMTHEDIAQALIDGQVPHVKIDFP